MLCMFGADQMPCGQVCDFGLSRVKEVGLSGGRYRMTGKTGSLRYMAPEVGPAASDIPCTPPRARHPLHTPRNAAPLPTPHIP